MQREKIEFPTNTPAVLKLDWNEGTLKPSRFGDEYMYMCDHDARVMWVKRELHTLIQESRRPDRQWFSIRSNHSRGSCVCRVHLSSSTEAARRGEVLPGAARISVAGSTA